MTSRAELDRLIEETLSARRPLGPRGELRFHPSWHDLDEAAREEAFEQLKVARQLEAAGDAEGLSSTSKEVLRRLMTR